MAFGVVDKRLSELQAVRSAQKLFADLVNAVKEGPLRSLMARHHLAISFVRETDPLGSGNKIGQITVGGSKDHSFDMAYNIWLSEPGPQAKDTLFTGYTYEQWGASQGSFSNFSSVTAAQLMPSISKEIRDRLVSNGVTEAQLRKIQRHAAPTEATLA